MTKKTYPKVENRKCQDAKDFEGAVCELVAAVYRDRYVHRLRKKTKASVQISR